jgi:hypothetical protein
MPDVKPLSAEEIAEMREWAAGRRHEREADSVRLVRLLDEVERTRADGELLRVTQNLVAMQGRDLDRARAPLRRIEWQGGEARYGFCCPDCGVEKNDERPAHAANCELAALLGGEG